MSIENKTPEQEQPNEKKDAFDYLEHLGNITEELIVKFRADLRPGKQKEFDSLDKQDKMIITALDYLSDQELKDLIKMGVEQGRLIGFHDVYNYLQKIHNLTGDERYKI